MRILQISSSRTYGGGERHFVDLCRGLQKRGHEVYAALRPTNVWQDRLDFLPPGNIFHVSIRNSFGILSATRMASFAREKGIEIVHAHVARDYIPASLACSMASSTKFVLTRHVLFPLKPFNRFALKNLSKAIGVSPGVGDALSSVFPKHKIEVILNGIDPTLLDNSVREQLSRDFRELHEIPEDALLVGTVGELLPLKGHRDLVLAANEVAQKFPDARFVIVGKDNTVDKKFRRELKRLVKVFELEDRFLWLDWVEDTRSLFSAFDLFVSASHTESFGMAILEAMACGTAVAATDTVGARELLGSSSTRVPINDPVKLADRISMLLADAEKRRELAEMATRIVAERFSLDRMVDETEELYRGLLAVGR